MLSFYLSNILQFYCWYSFISNKINTSIETEWERGKFKVYSFLLHILKWKDTDIELYHNTNVFIIYFYFNTLAQELDIVINDIQFVILRHVNKDNAKVLLVDV